MTSKLLLVCFLALAVGIAFAQVRTLEYQKGRDIHQIHTLEYRPDRPIRKARQVPDSPPSVGNQMIQPQPLAPLYPDQTAEDPNQVQNNQPTLPNEPQPGQQVYRYDTIDSKPDGSMNPDAPEHHLVDVSEGHTLGY